MPVINQTLGQYSELFMLLAAGTYTVAFIAFAWDLAKSSKTLQAVDRKAAEAAAAKVPVAVGAAGVSSNAAVGGTADGDMRYMVKRRIPARVAVPLTVLGA